MIDIIKIYQTAMNHRDFYKSNSVFL